MLPDAEGPMKPKLRLHWNVTSLSLRRTSGLFAWVDHVTFSARRGPLEAVNLAGSAAVRGEGGLASPHPILGAIAWALYTMSTCSCIQQSLFGTVFC